MNPNHHGDHNQKKEEQKTIEKLEAKKEELQRAVDAYREYWRSPQANFRRQGWKLTSKELPEVGQLVLYVFYPLGYRDLPEKEPVVFDGVFTGGLECPRGFCDTDDAPLWMPKPDFASMLEPLEPGETK